MIFSIQRHLEDLFERRGFRDPDQYAVKVANSYDQKRHGCGKEAFLQQMARIRTSFFRTNTITKRSAFEASLLQTLDERFKKKANQLSELENIPGGLRNEQRRIRNARRNISTIISEFRHVVEARCVDMFWLSRKSQKLRERPESIAQGVLAVFLKGVLSGRKPGFVIREAASGIGFVDIVLLLSSVPHLIEMKVLTSTLTGSGQLAKYMYTERRTKGWLVVFDARPAAGRKAILKEKKNSAGTIKIVTIDINPIAPSRHNYAN